MNGFKRFCYIVFAIIGILLLAALILPWVGPWTSMFAGFIEYDWYLMLIEFLVVICGIGFIVMFIRAVAARKRKDIVLFSEDGDEVRITRAAIASQATYLVEEDGTCYASKVIIKDKHGRAIDVKVYVEPHKPIEMAKEAKVLQKRLRTGLESLCSGKVDKIEISFTEPRVPTDLSNQTEITPAKEEK